MAATQTVRVVNGVDQEGLQRLISNVRQDPSLARFQFRVRNRWLGAAHSRSMVKDFYGAGKEDDTRQKPYVMDCDEPPVLLGQDQGANPVEHLLNALAGMGLLAKEDGVFHNTKVGARYLASPSPDNAREGLIHMVHLWPRWSTLTECVRVGTSVLAREDNEADEDWTRAFIAAMDRNAAERMPHVVRAVDLAGVRRMLDLGGGSGAYAIGFARATTDLQVEILDLAEVVPLTEKYIAAAGLSSRIRAHAGNLRTDVFGESFDLIWVSAICHMLDAQENRDLFKRCHNALAPHGRLVVQDFILAPDKTTPRSAALFALNMLVGTKGGSSYSVDEYAAWMREADFQDVKQVGLPGPTSLMAGFRR